MAPPLDWQGKVRRKYDENKPAVGHCPEAVP